MQRSFAFRLLPFTKAAFSFLLLASGLLALSSCSFNANYQGKGADFLQGEWKQDSVDRQKQLVSYSLYHFRFTCDSFYVNIASASKVNYGADTCMSKGHWLEYAKGTYEVKTDTLNLKGFFCNADYSLKKEGGCFRFGAYEDSFKLSSKKDSALSLSSFNSTIPIRLKLVKRISCVEKPL
jgi:hypothetical protein